MDDSKIYIQKPSSAPAPDSQQAPAPPPQPAPVPSPTPAPVQPQAPQKSKALSWFALVLVIAVLVFAYYAIGSNQGWWPFPEPTPYDGLPDGPTDTTAPAPEASPAATEDPTVGWVTHTSERHGFTFDHPADIQIQERADDPFPGYTFIGSNGGDIGIAIDINHPGRGGPAIIPSSEVRGEFLIGDISTSYFSGTLSAGYGSEEPAADPSRIWALGFEHADDSFLLVFSSLDSSDQTELVRLILSTFEFTQ